jgi:hypothetical protein
MTGTGRLAVAGENPKLKWTTTEGGQKSSSRNVRDGAVTLSIYQFDQHKKCQSRAVGVEIVHGASSRMMRSALSLVYTIG